ncbi:maestro heat-like repeat family member 5 [Suncus etruscus]|uniref:maestro heat-like repeat family member 5 n=1 Tax=Suncus etruscus TaxID=109475 RepID=UPI00210F937A|nr:maestro heat-like repeat family member 5 [Suncus etruscus]
MWMSSRSIPGAELTRGGRRRRREKKDMACLKAPCNRVCGTRQSSSTIMSCRPQSNQVAEVSQEHKVFMEEAYSAATCFKLLRDLNNSDPLYLKYIINKIKNMARCSPNMVLETIYDYFTNNPEISTRHKFRLLNVLESTIEASEVLEAPWEEAFTQLALDNMTKATELDEVYQDAAGNVLVAICKHSWPGVTRHLEAPVLSGVFPHRSLLYVLGVLSSESPFPAEELFDGEEMTCWEERLMKMADRSVQFLQREEWTQALQRALTKSERTHREQPPEKVFLFVYYGLILQAAQEGSLVRNHLQGLLQTSHQWATQREGMALTMGLASVGHLYHVWAVLEQFGQSKPVKWSLDGLSMKSSEERHWKWASCTILLSYGQMAAKAKTRILPWVDNILSRMIFYFYYSTWDDTLKQSFLSSVLMLVGAISRNEGAQSYEFKQLPELLDCLAVLMEKEDPDSLCTPSRQQALHIISRLCNFRPALDTKRKSRLLSSCLRSVLALPLMDVLEKHLCLFMEPPNIQSLYKDTVEALDQMLQNFIMQNPTPEELHFLLSHLYIWLVSEKTHERQRAALSCLALLKFLSHNCFLDPKEDFKRMGQLVGMLGILCQDPDRATSSCSLEVMGHLYQLLLHQRGPMAPDGQAPKEKTEAPKVSREEDLLWSSGDQDAASPVPQPAAPSKAPSISQTIKVKALREVVKHLTVTELTDLIWTAIDNLDSSSTFCVEAASEMLLTFIQEHGTTLETVASLGQAIHLQLCSIRIPQAKKNCLQALTVLAHSHTSELVNAFLDFSIPLDSHALLSWRALGAEQPVSCQVLIELLACLGDRPLHRKACLRSLAAMNTLQELQFSLEFRAAMREFFPRLLLALLAQTRYILELNPQREAMPSPLRFPPHSTSLDTLKSLLTTTGHWQDFAHLELQDTWALLTQRHSYVQGVGLFARTMVQNRCHRIKAVLAQLLISMHSPEAREREAALIFLEEFLYSPALLEVLPKEDAHTLLSQSLQDPSPEARVWGLQGLSNIIFHPEKESLLQGQLPHFLDGLFQDSEEAVVCVMSTISRVLHSLGGHSPEPLSLQVASSARFFFDDERDKIRAAAMALFGDVVTVTAGMVPACLHAQVHQGLVPLLLHLHDHSPAVASQAKFTFYRCVVRLHWPLQHTLFCVLAWEWKRSPSARHFLWACLIKCGQELFHVYLAQALGCLHSRHRRIQAWAAVLIGYTVCYHPQSMVQVLNQEATDLLLRTFESLKDDQEPGVQAFARGQLALLQKMTATWQP